MTMSPEDPGQPPSIPPKPELPNLAAARALGPAHATAVRWQQLLLVWRWHHQRHQILHPGRAYPPIAALIEATVAAPALRRLYPFTSHFTLNFSSYTSYPWLVRASIDPLSDGRFRVRQPRSREIIAITDTADTAVSLAADNLPAGLGPAINH